ncbi:MerR family DNA-binding transcriptional regulator [Schaedlerella arabinosiphila]|uniref:MerR family DNA-binding transcriptional regulator n=1 Tax=Schaedlerella arabinosiphila TaxID=2044587 RepID=UPI0026B3886F
MEYSIGEFSELTGLGIHTLRYYEQEGLIAPKRNSGNRSMSRLHGCRIIRLCFLPEQQRHPHGRERT